MRGHWTREGEKVTQSCKIRVAGEPREKMAGGGKVAGRSLGDSAERVIEFVHDRYFIDPLAGNPPTARHPHHLFLHPRRRLVPISWRRTTPLHQRAAAERMSASLKIDENYLLSQPDCFVTSPLRKFFPNKINCIHSFNCVNKKFCFANVFLR